MTLCGFCVSRKGGTGGGGCGHPQSDMYMVAASLGCNSGPGGPILALTAWTCLETLISLCSFLGSEQVFDKREC